MDQWVEERRQHAAELRRELGKPPAPPAGQDKPKKSGAGKSSRLERELQTLRDQLPEDPTPEDHARALEHALNIAAGNGDAPKPTEKSLLQPVAFPQDPDHPLKSGHPFASFGLPTELATAYPDFSRIGQVFLAQRINESGRTLTWKNALIELVQHATETNTTYPPQLDAAVKRLRETP